MLISYEGYQEALESQKQKEDQLNTVQSQLDSMQSQIQSLMSAFSNMQEKPQVAIDSMAKTLYSSGLIKAADAGKNKDNGSNSSSNNVSSNSSALFDHSARRDSR